MAVNLLPQAMPNAATDAASCKADDAPTDATRFANALATASKGAAGAVAHTSSSDTTTQSGEPDAPPSGSRAPVDADLLAALLSGAPLALAPQQPAPATTTDTVAPHDSRDDKPQRTATPLSDPAALVTASLSLLGRETPPAAPSVIATAPSSIVASPDKLAPADTDAPSRVPPREPRADSARPPLEAAATAPAQPKPDVTFAAAVAPHLAAALQEHKSVPANEPIESVNATLFAPPIPNTPAPAVQLTIATPAFTPAWRDEVAQQLTQMVLVRQDRAEIRLHPADLGPVNVQIVMDGSQANLLIQAPQPATREGLELALPQLRDSLAQQGITLGETSIRDQSQGNAQGDDRRFDAPRTDGPAAIEPQPAVRAKLGLIDLFA